ncbi:hypothetical protein Syun_015519 [Stephania yunnanensis]|uniref:Uncharacterized protein n=1 Tax=Stephania yunnanensis TaxID=152371 RepID=A0AAP0JLU4_9MAGN
MDVMLSVLGDSRICDDGRLDADHTVNKATCLIGELGNLIVEPSKNVIIRGE